MSKKFADVIKNTLSDDSNTYNVVVRYVDIQGETQIMTIAAHDESHAKKISGAINNGAVWIESEM